MFILGWLKRGFPFQHILALTLLAGCGPTVNFEQVHSKASSLGTGGAGGTGGGGQLPTLDGSDSFIQNQNTSSKMDILFIDDNSGSMEVEQEAMASRLSSFIDNLSGVDWQIGVTTTDLSNGPFGTRGALLPLPGTTDKNVLTPSSPNPLEKFAELIRRPETINCQINKTCPSGDEQPLAAAIQAMDLRSETNSNFFREGAGLAIVVLSDEDEMSSGGIGATTARDVMRHAKEIWGPSKSLTGYGIIIQPGDSECLATQMAQTGATAAYGTHVAELANLTGGITGSICATDYSQNLKKMGEHVSKVLSAFSLTHIPVDGSVEVILTPAQPIKWTVEGDKLLFERAPDAGTQISVKYKYQ